MSVFSSFRTAYILILTLRSRTTYSHPSLFVSLTFQAPSFKSKVHWPLQDNQPQVTEAIKRVLKDDYNYDSTVSVFRHPVPSIGHDSLYRILSALSIVRLRSAASWKTTEILFSTRTKTGRSPELFRLMLSIVLQEKRSE